jgi:hypothetical protein
MPVVQVPKQHPRVMVVVVTKDYVPQQCWDAILAQDYDNYSMMVHVLKSKLTNPNPNMQYSMRVAENKEIARTMALASAADDFLFVDSSVIIPPNAVSELVAQITVGRPDPNYEKYVEQTLKTKCVYVPKHAIAGYVPFNDSPLTYIMGRYVANYTGIYLHHITQSLTPIDFASCGCIMIDRVTLAKLVWNAGIDRYWMIEGRMAFFDDSCDLCAQIFDMPDETGKGHIQLYADGSVVCQHLPRANP